MGELGRKLVRELKFRSSCSSGPGGQHVNKTSSKVELIFDLLNTSCFGEVHRERLLKNLKNRIDKEGCLHMTEEGTRSQRRNKEVLIERFLDTINQALKVPKKRKPTKKSKASIKRRLDNKKKRSQLKRGRSRKWD